MPNPTAWTYRVAFNLVTLWFRRRAAEARARQRDQPVEPALPDHAQAVAVRTAIAAIPPRRRTAVALRYYLDLLWLTPPKSWAAAQATQPRAPVRVLRGNRDLTPRRFEFRPSDPPHTDDRPLLATPANPPPKSVGFARVGSRDHELRTALELAHRDGTSHVLPQVEETNAVALTLYERAGFARTTAITSAPPDLRSSRAGTVSAR